MVRLSLKSVALGLCVALFAAPALSREYLVLQKDRKFIIDGKEISTLQVGVGDTVSFQNSDPFIHNIFSESAPNDFDLGAFPMNVAESHTFQHPGEVDIKCAMHGEMKLKITVTPK